jgi:hypothetical protein
MQGKNDQTLGGLVSELSHDLLNLVRQEICFAQVEMSMKAGKAVRYALLIAAGGAFAFTALLLLLTGITTSLTAFFSPLAAAAIVSMIVGGFGFLLMGIGFYRFRREDFTPRRTIGLIREEKEWVEDRVA